MAFYEHSSANVLARLLKGFFKTIGSQGLLSHVEISRSGSEGV